MRLSLRKIALGILLISIILAGCSRESAQQAVELTSGRMPDQELWDAKVVFTENERITSILQAEYIAIYEAEGLTIADTAVKLDVFDKDGNHQSLLTADSGVVIRERVLQALGNVVVVSDSGVTVNTERMYWDRIRRTVRSDTFVMLTTETDTLFGDSLLSDEALENWQVFNPRGKTIRQPKK